MHACKEPFTLKHPIKCYLYSIHISLAQKVSGLMKAIVR